MVFEYIENDRINGSKTIIKKEKICNRLASNYVFGRSLKNCVKNLLKYILDEEKVSCVCRVSCQRVLDTNLKIEVLAIVPEIYYNESEIVKKLILIDRFCLIRFGRMDVYCKLVISPWVMGESGIIEKKTPGRRKEDQNQGVRLRQIKIRGEEDM